MPNKNDKSDNPRVRHAGVGGGNRLARRARSFKEDLLEKITQMRSPSSTRAASPKAKRELTTADRERRGSAGGDENNGAIHKPLPEDEVLVQQKKFQSAMRYFQDVVDKNKLEMLPGSASIVLETVLGIHNTLKICLTNEQSSVLVSSTNQVYQSLAGLVKLADYVLLHGDKSLDRSRIADEAKQVLTAVKTLVDLVVEKLRNKELSNGSSPVSGISHNGLQEAKHESCLSNLGEKSPVDVPLTQRELEILHTVYPGSVTLGHSVSSDSILSSTANNFDPLDLPPPKPPLPENRDTFRSTGRFLSTSISDMMPPALPPKTRLHPNSCVPGSNKQQQQPSDFHGFGSLHQQQMTTTAVAAFAASRYSGEWSLRQSGSSGSDWPSSSGRSPVSVSPMSASASSLDSTPNRSRDNLTDVVAAGQEFTTSTASYAYQSRTSRSLVSWTERRSPDEVDGIHRRLNESRFEQRSSSSATAAATVCSAIRNGGGGGGSGDSTVIIASAAAATQSFTSTCCVQRVGVEVPPQQHLLHPLVEHPPAIPPKRRSSQQRTSCGSQYDNVPGDLGSDEREGESSSPSCSPKIVRRTVAGAFLAATADAMLSASAVCLSSGGAPGDCDPPPLPLKKRNVMAYMQILGSCQESDTPSFLFPPLRSYGFVHRERRMMSHSRTTTISGSTGLTSGSEDSAFFSDITGGSFDFGSFDMGPTDEEPVLVPPALPPKKGKVGGSSSAPGSSPTHPELGDSADRYIVTEPNDYVGSRVSGLGGLIDGDSYPLQKPALEISSCDLHTESSVPADSESLELQILDELEVKNYLIYKKEEEDGPDIRGGSVDALVVHATMASKNEIVYQDAFMTTYRTFISPLDLVNKLLYRYNKFGHATDVSRQRIARNAFSLLVRVVGDFSVGDVNKEILQVLTEFVFKLLCNGELPLARALRVKTLEKYDAKLQATAIASIMAQPLSSKGVSTKQASLLDFKSEQLAEQMTLLDAELFQKIEIPEVLVWSRLQKEEASPHLTTFTEHFNKMSFWARSRILQRDDAKERERYVIKFIKIMKHLRKMNNFNSYLAILSALDSAPIRRLEWQKHITEGLKEFCELIDSSSSFRAYRQALSDTNPPCIPYIGLILQDLTFVHIGNNDSLQCGAVNFSKRWQQFNILDTMRRFRKCQYPFKCSERIVAFFNNFDDHLCEEAMWQISENIKPRGTRKKIEQVGS